MSGIEQAGMRRGPARLAFLQATAAAGAAAALAGALPQGALAAAPDGAACQESQQDILNTALAAEQLTVTFYYVGLTTPRLTHDTKLARDPSNLEYLKAALGQEWKHGQILAGLGATSPHTHFYFPRLAVERLGFTSHAGTYLWVLDHLETACIGAYLQTLRRFGALGRFDLALLAARLLGVEAEHRALYRAISEDYPANNLTVQASSFECESDIHRVLDPFLTGKGLPGGAPLTIPLPSSREVARIIGGSTGS